jgi:hypothetical protein
MRTVTLGRSRRGRCEQRQGTPAGPGLPLMEGPEIYRNLRAQALDAVELGLPAPPPEHPSVSGAVIDVPMGDGYITFVAMGDDSTSMYTSVGGGTIGAGQHEPVAAATHELLEMIEEHLHQFSESDDVAHPESGNVRVFALTPSGRRVADAPEDAFWGRAQGPLTPVLMAVQDVVSAIREVQG